KYWTKNFNPMKLSIIDRYIIRKYLGTFVFTMAIFTVVMVIFDVSERLDDFLEHKAPLSKIIFEYYAGFIPFYLNFLSPLINFIAVIFFTAKMADQTEIVPILSCGMSFNRFLRPYMISAGLIFLVTFAFNLYIIPKTNKLKIGFENAYVKPKDSNTKSSTHMQIDKNSFAFIESFDNDQKVGYKFIMEIVEGQEHKSKLIADKISWDSLKHNCTIQNYTNRNMDRVKEEMIRGPANLNTLEMASNDFQVYDSIGETRDLDELDARIVKEKMGGT